jgi:hypothetical protein
MNEYIEWFNIFIAYISKFLYTLNIIMTMKLIVVALGLVLLVTSLSSTPKDDALGCTGV